MKAIYKMDMFNSDEIVMPSLAIRFLVVLLF